MSPSQLLLILLRRSWIIAITFVSAMVGAGLLLYVVPPRYDAQATAVIDSGQSDPVSGQSVSSLALRVVQGNLAALAKSQRVGVDVVRRLNLTSNAQLMAQYRESPSVGRVDAAEWIAAEIMRNQDARFLEGTNVLLVTYKSSNPILAAQVANTFISAFTDAAIEAKVSGAQQTAQWFEPQIDKLRAEVDEARIAVSKFQAKAQLTPAGPGDTELSTLQQITTDIGTARAETVRIQAALAQVDTGGDNGALDAQPFDSALMQSLKKDFSSTQAEISRQQIASGSNNPKVQALIATQKSLLAQITAERKSTRSSLETRLKALQAQIDQLERARIEQLSKVVDTQDRRDQLSILSRDLEVKQERYVQALRASAAARMQAQLSFSNIALLDRAVTPVSPAFPKPTLVIPAAIVAGLGLGAIFALIAEALSRRIRIARDLDFATLAPSLGTLISAPVGRREHRRLARLRALALTSPKT